MAGERGETMAWDNKRADAELLAGRCRELEALARYNGFEFAAYLLSIAHEEFLKQQHLNSKRTAAKR
jgi:hypothetical protein